jgi:deoxyribodipyrimidine photo-lyase
MKSHRIALVWFRRDLRLSDNPALLQAVEHATAVVPIFVYAPDEEGHWAPGAASRWWLNHSLAALDADLRERGSRLTLRSGPTLATLRDLIATTGATLVVSNRLYEPAIIERDKQITSALQEDGVAVESSNAALLFEPWTIRNGQDLPYRVFTPFWRNAETRLEELPTPAKRPRGIGAPERWPRTESLASFELLPRIRWDSGLEKEWTPGEAGALARVKRFAKRVGDYDRARDRPDEDGTSALSPHLHFGEVGPRQILAALAPERAARTEKSFATYRRELGWREFAHHLLYHFPTTPDRPLDVRFENLGWARDSHALAAWQRGATGYPIIDAGMRQLWATGWMHNRVRMIVASLLTKNLQLHWLEGARWFWDTLVDADLANNTLGWQWTAGCGADAAPYYRIFNPMLQTERFDPDRAYLRRWVPEIAKLPDNWIHRPFAAPAEVLAKAHVTLGHTYPAPIVDLKESREAALAAYDRIRH